MSQPGTSASWLDRPLQASSTVHNAAFPSYIVLQYSVYPGHRDQLEPKGESAVNWVIMMEAL